MNHPITRPPTQRQREILNFVIQFTAHSQRLPSTRTLQQAFGFKSQNSAVCHLKALVRRRLLNHTMGGYSLPINKP